MLGDDSMSKNRRTPDKTVRAVKESLEIMKAVGHYNKWLFSTISPFVHGDILEIGAGIGTFTFPLTGLGNVTTVDNNPDCVAHARELLKETADVGFGDIETGKYFFGKRRFDSIVCLNVLEHIKDDLVALANMYALLKPQGRLILLVPSHKSLYGALDERYGHWRRYSKKPLAEKLRGVGFIIQEMRYLNWFGAIGWFVNGRILSRNTLPRGPLSIFDIISRPALLIERYLQPPFGISVLAIGEKR